MTAETVPTQRKAPETHVLVVAGEAALRFNMPSNNGAAVDGPALDIDMPDTGYDHLATPTPEPLKTPHPDPPLKLPDDRRDKTVPGDDRSISVDTVKEPGTVLSGEGGQIGAAQESWELVERIQNGETEAFAQLYTRYFDTVYRFIYHRIKEAPHAQDLTSDTFLRAFRGISKVAWQGRDIGAWLITIARNIVADHYKSSRTRLEVGAGNGSFDGVDSSPEGDPEGTVIKNLTNITLSCAVEQLNPEQQQCIVLRFLNGLSVAETAQAMGKNEGAIKALQYRAVRSLRRVLEGDFLHQV